MACLCLATASLPAAADDALRSQRPQPGDLIVAAEDKRREPLRPADIALGELPLEAWALEPSSGLLRDGSRLNRLLVMRLDPATLDPATAQIAAEGVVAYTAICTHTGCEVMGWIPETQILECPCHNSLFDPKRLGTVVGGPAPRRLPALPLALDGGRLVVAKPFNSRIGFQQA